MKILFNKIKGGVFTENQKLVKRDTVENVIPIDGEVNHLGICNWSGFNTITINNVVYALPAIKSKDQYFVKLRQPITEHARVSGLPDTEIGIGALFLGVLFDKLKTGKVETRKIMSTNKVKSTLTAINYTSDYGIQYMTYAGQCPPLLNAETAKEFMDLISYNNNRNVIIQFECNEFGVGGTFVYGYLTADTMTTQGLDIYGTKMKFTERF